MSAAVRKLADELLVWAEKYKSEPWNMLPLATSTAKDMSPMKALKIGVESAHALAAAMGRAEAAEKDLRHFGRHVPPCPRWVTSGSPDFNPCLCGFDEALAVAAESEDVKVNGQAVS